MRRTWTRSGGGLLLLGALLGPGELRAEELRAKGRRADEAFVREVAPILRAHCLRCHDDERRTGELSLQGPEGLRESGAVVPGDPEASPLLELLTPVDGRAAMPRQADPLSDAQRAAIADWIRRGAAWPEGLRLEPAPPQQDDWWSARPIERPAVPAIDDPWVRTPVDAFVLRALRERGLTVAEEADRRSLIRRLFFDLVGLPPSPEEVEAFVADPRPDAYERLVDRLLDSPRHGERWARHWLDVVKYADTCGYDKDKLRPNAWPYRDYVVRSFNEDKPYSRFVQEQIAGDVLFPGEEDGILGLGFIAAGPWDFIGHVEVPESKIDGKVARNLDRDDMVSNALNSFCSLTVQCARCHDHKFDPISMEQYYGLQAVFAAVDRADRPYAVDEEVEARRAALGSSLARVDAARRAVDGEVSLAIGPRRRALQARIAELEARHSVEKDPAFGYHSEIVAEADVPKWVQVDLGAPVVLQRIVLRPCHDDFAGIGGGFGFPRRFAVEISEDGGSWTVVLDHRDADFPNPGVSPVEAAIDGARARFVRVTATRLAERQDDHILALAELEAFDAEGRNHAAGAAVSSRDSIEAPVRWARVNLTDGSYARETDPEAGRALFAARAELGRLEATVHDPERSRRRARLKERREALQSELASLPEGRMVYAAATHFPRQGQFRPTEGRARTVHVLRRGDVRYPGEPAEPGLLPLNGEAAPRIDPALDEGERRAALARWLVSPEHPLVWRSIVNRVWQFHFDGGLVATPNDFGRMGATPTHPELLDWLAAEFRDGDQGLKGLHRLLVTSSVYRQSSAHHPANAAVDGSNQFLWRMPRRRLSAEEIRDAVLVVSGAMDLRMGGPGVRLFELERTEHSPHYQYHKFDPADPATHRRSIYRFVVRSQPDPWMTTFDCADSSQSTPRRTETLTALQALSLMNSRFSLVMAERFAQRLEAERPGDLDAQLERALRLLVQRALGEEERAELRAHARRHGLPSLCRLMFNFSEFVFVD